MCFSTLFLVRVILLELEGPVANRRERRLRIGAREARGLLGKIRVVGEAMKVRKVRMVRNVRRAGARILEGEELRIGTRGRGGGCCWAEFQKQEIIVGIRSDIYHVWSYMLKERSASLLIKSFLTL